MIKTYEDVCNTFNGYELLVIEYFNNNNIPFALTGSKSLKFYGIEKDRKSSDIDIVVEKKYQSQVHRLLSNIHFVKANLVETPFKDHEFYKFRDTGRCMCVFYEDSMPDCKHVKIGNLVIPIFPIVPNLQSKLVALRNEVSKLENPKTSNRIIDSISEYLNHTHLDMNTIIDDCEMFTQKQFVIKELANSDEGKRFLNSKDGLDEGFIFNKFFQKNIFNEPSHTITNIKEIDTDILITICPTNNVAGKYLKWCMFLNKNIEIFPILFLESDDMIGSFYVEITNDR